MRQSEVAAWPPKGRRELTDRRPWSRPRLAERGPAEPQAAGAKGAGSQDHGGRCHLVVAALRSPRSLGSGQSPGSWQAPKAQTVPVP